MKIFERGRECIILTESEYELYIVNVNELYRAEDERDWGGGRLVYDHIYAVRIMGMCVTVVSPGVGACP